MRLVSGAGCQAAKIKYPDSLLQLVRIHRGLLGRGLLWQLHGARASWNNEEVSHKIPECVGVAGHLTLGHMSSFLAPYPCSFPNVIYIHKS